MSTQPIRILLVEDDEDDYFLTRDVIERIDGAPYDLVWCETFANGLTALKEQHFDVGLIDYKIGGQSGIDFLKAVRLDGISVPMILLTGLGDREVDIAASEAGAADFLEKGDITPALAERSIRFACKSAAAQRRLAEQSGLLQATLDNTGSAIAALSAHGHVVASNQRLRELVDELTTLVTPSGITLPLEERGGQSLESALVELVALARAHGGKSCELRTAEDRVLSISMNESQEGGSVIVIHDITEQRVFEEALTRAKNSAEAASRSKSAFLATMSHELRTPLNAIIGFSELMLSGIQGKLQPSPFVAYVQDILESGRHLLDIINAILDFSKAEAGRYKLNAVEVDLRTQFEFCVGMMKHQGESAGVDLIVDHMVTDAQVIADLTAFRRMLINILSNAIKFTNKGGEVHLSATQSKDGSLTIVVTDNGIGIAEEDLPLVMQPFYQAHSTEDRLYEGTGLGLAIVSSLAELQGASLEIHSTLGNGTSVMLTFPPEIVVATKPLKIAPAAKAG